MAQAPRPSRLLIALVLSSLWTGACLAGRPLIVDDANVNEPGAGHIEAWYAHQADGGLVWVIAPAYAPRSGVELSAALARDTATGIDSGILQAKFLFTPSREDGCNFGTVLGASHASGPSGMTPYALGVMTCNVLAGALHVNLGASRPPDGPTLPAFGIAWEQDVGFATLHAEWLGQRQSKPTLDVGVRKEIFKNFQVNGSVGQSGGEPLFSLGMKLQFQAF